MKKGGKIIVCIIIFVLLAGGVFLSIQLYSRDNIIDKLEQEIEDLEDETSSLKKDKEEMNYSLELYKDLYGSIEEESDSEEEYLPPQNNYSNLKQVSYKTLEKMINNEEDFILLISQTYCSHCIEYKPILNETLKEYNIVAYDIDINNLTQDELEKLDENIAQVSGTPTTIFIQDGQEISTTTRLVGSKTKKEITDRLEALGYIK